MSVSLAFITLLLDEYMVTCAPADVMHNNVCMFEYMLNTDFSVPVRQHKIPFK